MRIWISELVDRKWRHSQVRAVFELSYTTNMRYFVKQTISFPFISDHVFEIQFLKFEDFKYATWNWWLTYGHGIRAATRKSSFPQIQLLWLHALLSRKLKKF